MVYPWCNSFCVLTYFVIVGTSNAVNLTDGLDGLAAMPVVLVAAALSVFAYVAGHTVFAQYLGLPHIPGGARSCRVFCAAMCGACLGFLWFNAYPAQVFMGDVGALALGAALGAVAVIVRQEIVLFVMGGVFVMEAVSVMLQVASFKMTGKRIFRMAPLHHHFELKGWKETCRGALLDCDHDVGVGWVGDVKTALKRGLQRFCGMWRTENEHDGNNFIAWPKR